MSWFSFLRSLFVEEPEFTGALVEEDDGNRIAFGEIVSTANPVTWVDRAPRSFPVVDQKRSLMCVAFSGAKYLGVQYFAKHGEYLPFSEAHIYQRRRNRPSPGMYLGNVFGLMKDGVTLKILASCPITTDADAELCPIAPYQKSVGEVFRLKGEPIYLGKSDFETAASVIQTTGKGIICLFYFTSSEWGREVPVMQSDMGENDPRALRHAVVAVDFVLKNGEKCLVIEDSAHFGGINRRYITESFWRKRNILSGYTMSFVFDTEGRKPYYDGSVQSLQDCLKAEGVFPQNIASTGFFGTLTRRAVIEFQKKYGLEQVGDVGPKTAAVLKEKYPL